MNGGNTSADWISRLVPLILMLFSSGALLTKQPFRTSRQGAAEAQSTQRGEEKITSFSRLWQDPFYAVKQASAPLREEPPDLLKNARLVAVMVTGNPTGSGDEWRRRYRHAVIAGLHEADWVPWDGEQILVRKVEFKKPLPTSEPAAGTAAPATESAGKSSSPATSRSSSVSTSQIAPDGLVTTTETTVTAIPTPAQAAKASTISDPLVVPMEVFVRSVTYREREREKEKEEGVQKREKAIKEGKVPVIEPVVEKLVVAWLNEDVFTKDPAAKLRHVVDTLLPSGRPVHVLGPWGSSTLIALAEEANPRANSTPAAPASVASEYVRPPDAPRPLILWSTSATVADHYILGGDGDFNPPTTYLPRVTLANKVRDLVDFRNLGCTDMELARALWGELCVRSEVRKGSPLTTPAPRPDSKDAEKAFHLDVQGASPLIDGKKEHIILLSELDTLYGRSFSQVMQQWFEKSPGLKNSFEVHRYTYVRGMDGDATYSGSAPKAVDKASSADAQKKPVVSSLEHSFGTGMLDYTRRLAHRIKLELDGKKVYAVGLFGTDVYDKILLLQALKPLCPGVVFFTTDLDARLMDQEHLEVTRNLIVASPFHLHLEQKLQGSAPPFRDSYQTGVFLSAQFAGGKLQLEPDGTTFTKWGIAPLDPLDSAGPCYTLRNSNQGLMPLVFEIGRDEAVQQPLEDRNQRLKSSWRPIHSPDGFYDDLGLNFDRFWKIFWWLSAILGLTALCLANFGYSRSLSASDGKLTLLDRGRHLVKLSGQFICRTLCGDLRRWNQRGFKDPRDLRKQVLWVLIACLIVLIFMSLAFGFLSDAANERLRWAAGTSIWPSILVRGVGLALTVLMIARCWWVLESNWTNVVGQFALDPGNKGVLLDRPEKTGAFWSKILAPIIGDSATFWHVPTTPRPVTGMTPPIDDSTPTSSVLQKKIDAVKLLQQYRVEDGADYTIIRCATRWVLYFLIAIIGWSWLKDNVEPFRGPYSFWANSFLNIAYPLVYAFLVIYVAYAIQLLTRVTHLLTQSATEWPAETLRQVGPMYGMTLPATGPLDKKFDVLDEVIDIKFIAERSAAVGQMIYYPFLSLLVLVFARNPWFDRWQWSFGIVMLFCVHALYAIGCAIMMRNAAEKARAAALASLNSKLLAAQAQPKEDGCVKQIEAMVAYITHCQTGAFANISRQPWITAALLPAGGMGLLNALQWF